MNPKKFKIIAEGVNANILAVQKEPNLYRMEYWGLNAIVPTEVITAAGPDSGIVLRHYEFINGSASGKTLEEVKEKMLGHLKGIYPNVTIEEIEY